MAVTLPPNVPSYQAAAASPTTARNVMGASTKEIEDNFMRMLIAQIQNQDPLNPQDSAQFTSQLAQLNMVKGVESLNTTMSGLVAQMQAAQLADRASLLGRTALAEGASIPFEGLPVTVGANLAGSAASVIVSIRDASGRVVDRVDLGTRPAGVASLVWDGIGEDGQRVPAGRYTLSVDAFNAAGARVEASTLVASEVAAVRREGTGIGIALADGRTVTDSAVAEWMK